MQLGDERVPLTADWPISIDEVFAASERLRAHLVPPLRGYAPLDEAAGGGIRVLVEHENHQPTNAFKVRNPLSALTLLDGVQRRRGALGATRQPRAGGAWAGVLLAVPVTICVLVGNNPEKNRAMAGYGARGVRSGLRRAA